MGMSVLPAAVDAEAAQVDKLSREVLRDGTFAFDVRELQLTENDHVHVVAKLRRSPGDVDVDVAGDGVGLIDAFFDGVLRVWGSEYPSLKTVVVADFAVCIGDDGNKSRRSDASAVATLRMKNSHDTVFTFESRSPSVTRSSLRVALDAVTFFINAERAWVQLQLAIKDATERRRSDLVARYRQQMGVLVHATSYEALRDGE
jgi:hypothetical protein